MAGRSPGQQQTTKGMWYPQEALVPGHHQDPVKVPKWVFRGRAWLLASALRPTQLCDFGQLGTLSGLQFPINHLSLQIVQVCTLVAVLCAAEADFQ